MSAYTLLITDLYAIGRNRIYIYIYLYILHAGHVRMNLSEAVTGAVNNVAIYHIITSYFSLPSYPDDPYRAPRHVSATKDLAKGSMPTARNSVSFAYL